MGIKVDGAISNTLTEAQEDVVCISLAIIAEEGTEVFDFGVEKPDGTQAHYEVTIKEIK